MGGSGFFFLTDAGVGLIHSSNVATLDATSPDPVSSRKISICSVCAFAPWNSGRPAFLAPFVVGRFHVADLATVYSDGLKLKRSSLTLTSPSAVRSALGVGAP